MQVTDKNGNIFGPHGLQVNGPDGKPKVISSGGGGGSIPHGTASGTDTYTVSITGATSYADGDAYLVRFTNGNTTGSTLNINGLGAITLYRNNDGELIGGDIQSGAEMLCVYNSTLNVFQVIGTSPNTLLAYVTNAEAITITKGQPVYAFGGQGDRLKVKLAYNTSDATSAQTVGLVLSTSIGANQKGFIILNGQLDGLSILPTSTWADGDPVYLGATAGSITKIKPHAPNHLVYLGFVTTANNGSAGRMYVRVQNGYELDELHDVQISGLLDNDIIQYDLATDLWQNKSLSNAITLTTTGSSGPATLTGSTLNIPQYGGSSSLTVGTTAIASGTVGGVLFQGTGNVLQQSGNLFWDNTNGRLGIGGTPGAFNLDVNGTARVNGDLSVTTGAIKSIVSSVTSQFTSYNPSNNFPRCQFQVGQNASDVNAGLTIAPLFSSTGVQKPTFIQISTNKNTIDTGQFSGYFSVSTSLFTIGTNKQDGQVAGGVPIVFSPANTEALRIHNNGNIGINTTTDAGFKLHVNGTARVVNNIFSGNGTYFTTGSQSIASASTANAYVEISSGASNSAALIFSKAGSLSTLWQLYADSSSNIAFFRNGVNKEIFKIFESTKNIGIDEVSGTSTFLDVASAKLFVNSTTKGFLPPRMTNAQMLAIAAPAAGLVVYDTTNNKHCGYNGTAWQNFY